jgi:hypothetical protein
LIAIYLLLLLFGGLFDFIFANKNKCNNNREEKKKPKYDLCLTNQLKIKKKRARNKIPFKIWRMEIKKNE